MSTHVSVEAPASHHMMKLAALADEEHPGEAAYVLGSGCSTVEKDTMGRTARAAASAAPRTIPASFSVSL